MNLIKNIEYLKLVSISSLETLRINLQRSSIGDTSNQHIESLRIFFIFSLGRSGTQFLSRLLNAEQSSIVVHEPLKRDVIEYIKTFGDGYNYKKYIELRLNYIKSIVSKNNIKVYGEVNSYLRRHAFEIMAHIPNVKGFYLIRDGRDVVRSMMSRSAMSNAWFYKNIVPEKDDPYFDLWPSMSQFEKCCWVWASENKRLYDIFGPAIKFEHIISDYEYFKSSLLDALCLDISKEKWKAECARKSENRTRIHTFDKYEKWSPKLKDTFWSICGDIMQKHGYHENAGQTC